MPIFFRPAGGRGGRENDSDRDWDSDPFEKCFHLFGSFHAVVELSDGEPQEVFDKK
jgi:hypothetical protein